MGCGGSKDEVATGNTMSINRLLRRKSSTIDRERSIDTVSKEQEATKTDQNNDKLTVVKAVEEEKVTPPELSSQSSSDKEGENTKTNVVMKDISDNSEVEVLKESVQTNTNEKSEILGEEEESHSKDEDGESIGKNSVDFKEAISIEELEGEAIISDKKNLKESEVQSVSSSH